MSDEPEFLDASQSWSRLRRSPVGRVAAVVDGVAVIRPVNFAVDHGTLLMRTAYGSLIATLAGHPVVFEVDGTDETGGDVLCAWSVIIDGNLRAVARTEELSETLGVPLFPWHASPKPLFLRLEPERITGRRFPVAAASTWSTPLADVHPTAPE